MAVKIFICGVIETSDLYGSRDRAVDGLQRVGKNKRGTERRTELLRKGREAEEAAKESERQRSK
jgi:hypothetical protein